MWHQDILDIMVTAALVLAGVFLVVLGVAWASYYIAEWIKRRD
jgi:hypothetical protein